MSVDLYRDSYSYKDKYMHTNEQITSSSEVKVSKSELEQVNENLNERLNVSRRIHEIFAVTTGRKVASVQVLQDNRYNVELFGQVEFEELERIAKNTNINIVRVMANGNFLQVHVRIGL